MAEVQLAHFLREVSETEWVFGQSDCSMTVANWVYRATGIDPGKSVRGRYRTERGWKRIVNREGGLVRVFERLAAEAGLVPTSVPRPGDIGLVRLPGHGAHGAIRTPRGWFVRIPHRVVIAPFKTIVAWKV